MNREELKQKSKVQINNKLGTVFLMMLIIYLITFFSSLILSLIPGGGAVITVILTPAFNLSMARAYLYVAKGFEINVTDTFSGFNDYFSSFKTELLSGIITFLYSLLLIVPGIIKAVEYSFALMILAENKGKSARECLKESKAMTYGHRMELFKLYLSFIGWMLLTLVTCGVLGIWTIPYMNVTFTNAYLSLKAEGNT